MRMIKPERRVKPRQARTGAARAKAKSSRKPNNGLVGATLAPVDADARPKAKKANIRSRAAVRARTAPTERHGDKAGEERSGKTRHMHFPRFVLCNEFAFRQEVETISLQAKTDRNCTTGLFDRAKTASLTAYFSWRCPFLVVEAN